jgi:hypothetical protein
MVNIFGIVMIVAMLAGLTLFSLPIPQKASAICESVEPGYRY